MKQTIIAVIFSVLLMSGAEAFADTPAVSMVSYEQKWSDNVGTIALKNNTSADIHEVKFMLEYLDMQGRPEDYKTFLRRVEIAPGMTRKVNVDAYESARNYQYYKDDDGIMKFPKFKVKYTLISCDGQGEAAMPELKTNPHTVVADDDVDAAMTDGILVAHEMIVVLAVVLFAFGIYAGLYAMVAVMAQRRNRNPVAWLLLSFLLTPLLVCIILLAAGHSYRGY